MSASAKGFAPPGTEDRHGRRFLIISVELSVVSCQLPAKEVVMGFVMGLVIGCFSGGVFGIVLMCLLAGGSRRRRMYRWNTPSNN